MEDYDLGFIYSLFGETASKILLYINTFNESYATEIAGHFLMKQQTVRYHLEKLEGSGILISWFAGRTRMYRINPRYVLRNELVILLEKAMKYLPQEIFSGYFVKRTRPRTKGKTLRKYED